MYETNLPRFSAELHKLKFIVRVRAFDV